MSKFVICTRFSCFAVRGQPGGAGRHDGRGKGSEAGQARLRHERRRQKSRRQEVPRLAAVLGMGLPILLEWLLPVLRLRLVPSVLALVSAVGMGLALVVVTA
jgi:hypothetical protein